MTRNEFFEGLGRFSKFSVILYLGSEMSASFSDTIISADIFDDKITIWGKGTTYVDLPGDPIVYENDDEIIFEGDTYQVGIVCS